jgi:ribosomal-protein-alanine N-acetyltransferase
MADFGHGIAISLEPGCQADSLRTSQGCVEAGAMISARYLLREAEMTDAEPLAEAYSRNRDHLAPWAPIRPESFYTASFQKNAMRERSEHRAAGQGRSWVVVHDGQIVGWASLSNVVRGVFQSCNLGYWVDRDHQGRGLASAAVETACSGAVEWGLHRIEAGTLPHNAASQAVLDKCGFTRYGTAPDYLFIAGEWQDHVLFQKVLHDAHPSV